MALPRRLALLTIAALLAAGATVALVPRSPSPAAPNASGAWQGFVGRDGNRLVAAGQSFRFDGLNVPQATGAPCWYQRDLEAALTAIGSGQEIIRAFVFQRTAITNGVRDWTWVDRMLRIVRAHRERVIVVLADEWHGQPCSDLPSDRTIDWYRSGYRSLVEGVATYRDWVREIVSRYRNDPTVAFWELVNEPQARNADGSCSETAAASALRDFAADVGGLVKSVDPNHLVSLGAIPDHCGTDRNDYRAVNAVPSLDLCDFHDYSTGPMGTGDPRNGLAASIAQCASMSKPLFVGEMGIGFGSLTPPTRQERARLFDAKLAAQLAAGSSGELLWTWSQEFSDVPPRDQEIAPGDPALRLLAKY